MSSKSITRAILVCMVLGIIVGYFCNTFAADADTAKTISGYFGVVADIFLRLIKMIIAPLVFSTLVVGIAHMGDTKAIGRIGAEGDALVRLRLLRVAADRPDLVNILRPGDNLNLPLPDVQRRHQPQGLVAQRSRTSSPIWCRAASSRRWRPTRSCRSSCSRSSSASPAARARRQGEGRRARDRGVRPRHPQGDRLHHELLAPVAVFAAMAASSRRRASASWSPTASSCSISTSASPCSGAAGDRRLPAARQRCRAPVPADPRAVPAGLQHRQQRGRLPGHHGAAVQVSR